MQRYKSHKTVEAAKILKVEEIRRDDDKRTTDTLIGHSVECDDGRTYNLDTKVFARGKPAVGDYLVKYRDGYVSWSPAKEFEDGYTVEAAEQQPTTATEAAIRQQTGGQSLNPFRAVYRTLTPEEAHDIEILKDQAWALWRKLDQLPPGRHVALAKTALEESVMWAVKAATA